MALPDDDDDVLLERVLSAAHPRLLDAETAGDSAAQAHLHATQEALGWYALASVSPVAPPASLRARLAQSLTPRAAPKRALLVLDMLVDHLTPGRPLEVPRARAIVPALQARLAQARAAGEPVLFLCDRHAPDDTELHAWAAHNVEGTPGAEVWPALAPLPTEPQVLHRTYSAFAGSELEAQLRARGVDTVVLTGCVTELGLFITAADALMRGFTVEVPPECQAGHSPIGEAVMLRSLSAMVPLR